MDSAPETTTSADSTASRGFTLVELLVAMVLGPILIGGIVAMVLVVFNSQTNGTNSLTGTADASAISAKLTADVQSSTAITTTTTPSCGSTGHQIIALESDGGQSITAYVLLSYASGDKLTREVCAASDPAAIAVSQLLSRNIPASQTVTVSCDSSVTCEPTTSWVSSADVSTVSLHVSEVSTGASFAVSATPREWSSSGGGGPISYGTTSEDPLIVLGQSSCGSPNVSLSGSAKITVASGSLFDESTCADAVTLAGASSITASGLVTSDATPSTAESLAPSTSAPTATYGASTGDPLVALTAPTTPTTSATGSCPASGDSGTCTPGLFSAAVTLASSVTVTLNSGTYVFSAPVTIDGAATVTFDSGTYDFAQGLSIGGSAKVTFGAGTYLFAGATSSSAALAVSGAASLTTSASGVLLYVQSGTCQFTGSGSVQLTGEAAYDGVALWQAAADTNAVELSGASAVADSYGGVYAPGADVTNVGSATLSAAFLVAASVDLSGATTFDL